MKPHAFILTSIALSVTVCDAVTVITQKTPHGGIQPRAILDSKGDLHLIYFKGEPMGGNVFYIKQKKSSDSWTNPVRVNSISNSVVAVGTMRGAQIALGKNGRVHVAWNASPTYTKSQKKPEQTGDGKKHKHDPRDNRFMFYTRLNDAGTAFEKQRNVITRTFGLDGGGTVAADATGNVFVIWHGLEKGSATDETGRAVYVTHSSDEGKKFSPEQRANKDDTGACGCCGLSAIANGKGGLHITFRSAIKKLERDTYHLVSQGGGANFRSSVVDRWRIQGCPGSSFALTQSPSGIIGSWETRRQVFFSKLQEKSEHITAPGKPSGRKNPSLAVNAKGEVLLTWNQGGGWRQRGSLGWQAYDETGKPLKEHGGVPNGIPVWSLASAVVKADGTFVIFH
jgi:hypothetical protein